MDLPAPWNNRAPIAPDYRSPLGQVRTRWKVNAFDEGVETIRSRREFVVIDTIKSTWNYWLLDDQVWTNFGYLTVKMQTNV